MRRFLVERQVGGVVAEIIAGVRYDPTFGHALLVGAGGVLVELIEDRRTLLLPTTRAAIESAVDSLRVSKLLRAFRGRPRGDCAALVDALEALARLAWQERERLYEIDVNPLLVLGEELGLRGRGGGGGGCAGDLRRGVAHAPYPPLTPRYARLQRSASPRRHTGALFLDSDGAECANINRWPRDQNRPLR